jgi:uncharacterized protein
LEVRVGKGLVPGLAACVVAAIVTAAEVTPSFPARHFDDRAGYVSPVMAARLDARLHDFETRTGHAVYVSIFPRLPSPSLEDFTIRTATAWRIGRKNVDDGVILFAFVADRKLRIEVGYGLEGTIPDALAHRILTEYVTPALKAGRTDDAFEAGVDALIAAAEGRPLPAPSAPPSEGAVPPPSVPETAESPPGPEGVPEPALPTGLDRVLRVLDAIVHFRFLGLPVGLAALALGFPLSTSPILRFFPIRRRLKAGQALPRAWFIESMILLWIIVSNLGSGRSGGSTTSSGGSSSSGGGGGRFGGGGASGSW